MLAEILANTSDISNLFAQGKCIFIREKSGNFESDVCGNHVFIS